MSLLVSYISSRRNSLPLSCGVTDLCKPIVFPLAKPQSSKSLKFSSLSLRVKMQIRHAAVTNRHTLRLGILQNVTFIRYYPFPLHLAQRPERYFGFLSALTLTSALSVLAAGRR